MHDKLECQPFLRHLLLQMLTWEIQRHEERVFFLDMLIGLDDDHPAFAIGTELRKLAPRLG